MKSNTIYQSLIDTSQNAFFFAKTNGAILEANKAACIMFGYTEEELKRLGGSSILDTKDPLFAQMMIERQKDGTINGFLTGIRKNGEYFPLMYSSVRLIDDNGEEIVSIEATDFSEQRKQEQQLIELLQHSKELHKKEEEDRALLETVLDNITDGFFIVDNDWKILFWNRTAERILGRNEKDLIGKNVWDEFPVFAPLREYKDYNTLYNLKQSVHFQEYYPAFSIWADVSAYPSDNYISVYFKDITEIKSLQTLESLERQVLEMNAKPDIPLTDTLDFFMKGIEEIHSGMTCSILRLKNGRLYNWSAPSLPKIYIDAIEGGEIGENMGSCGTAAFRKEKVVVTDIENDPKWALFKDLSLSLGYRACWSFPILDSNNDVLGTFAVYYKKVKEPTQKEESTLERMKNLLMIILENTIALETITATNQSYNLVSMATRDAIWDCDIETNIVKRSGSGLTALFGYDIEETMNDNNFWLPKIHPDDIDRVMELQTATLNNPNESFLEHDYRFLKKDGKYAYVNDKSIIIRDKNGKAIRLLGATRDVSEIKENEALLLELNNRLKQRAEALAASNIELERFAYIASHDMQEPLRMITSFLQLFKKKYEGQLDATAEQYIHFAVDGAERMKKLIMDLLEYSRVSSNKENYETIHAHDLVESVLNLFSDRIEEMKVVVSMGKLPVIVANKTQMFQLFQNLIGNALKYHSGNLPQIIINGKEEEGYFLFSVMDNGIGIKPVFFDKIFLLFQRLHHKNEYSGTGIGLTICKKIIDRHYGKIWVESEPGKGSCFYFTIGKLLENQMTS